MWGSVRDPRPVEETREQRRKARAEAIERKFDEVATRLQEEKTSLDRAHHRRTRSRFQAPNPKEPPSPSPPPSARTSLRPNPRYEGIRGEQQ